MLRHTLPIRRRMEEAMNFWQWLAYRLPRRVVYWVLIRVGAEVTTGQHGNTIVPELTFMDALERFDTATEGGYIAEIPVLPSGNI